MTPLWLAVLVLLLATLLCLLPPLLRRPPPAEDNATAVSYTHLDVYKRQGPACTSAWAS